MTFSTNVTTSGIVGLWKIASNSKSSFTKSA